MTPPAPEAREAVVQHCQQIRVRMDNREVSGVRRAIRWLHERADEMNDPHAKAILNTAAFNLGVQLSKWQCKDDADART